jgi:dienelactone hydrolase
MDTLRQRWARLWPHIVELSPPGDEARPAVLLFHGCGGVRAHLHRYARAAAEAGWRAFLVDSYGPRGWSNRFASHFICIGLAFRGYKRAGDVLAAAWGVAQLPGVDPRKIALAGWSHGSWAIMDLMTLFLTKAGEVGLADPDPAPLDGVTKAFLAYPYVNLLARSRTAKWLRRPKVFGIVPRSDHLASVRTHMRAYASALAGGSEVELWSVDATHAFDEPGLKAPESVMRHDPALLDEAVERFRRFLAENP